MGRRIQRIAPSGSSTSYRIKELLNPMNWVREFRFDRQRMNRGWSDRDTWDMGNHLLEVTSGMLKKLGDEKSHIDWPAYFKENYNNNRGYKSLQEVAADIDNYLAFEETAFTDRLDFEVKHGTKEMADGSHELINLNSDSENRQIRRAMVLHHEEEQRLYEKAKNAMFFVAINFRGLWD